MSAFIDVELRTRIADLFTRYAHAIDNDELESWPGFFIAEAQYLITTRDNHLKGLPVGIMYCDGQGMMHDRVTAVRQAIVYAPHVYRHIFSMPLITVLEDGAAYAADTNFHILRTNADGAMVTYACGRCLDEIVMRGGGSGGEMLFRKRTVVLDSSRIDTLLVIPL